MVTKYGFSQSDWNNAKAEISDILIDVAQQKITLTYGELARQLTMVILHPGSYALGALLREICHDEEQADRGLLCALVVRKSTGQPGDGFFKYAAQFGRDLSDPTAFWENEISNLYDIWKHDT